MSNYSYNAMDASGMKVQGTLDVIDQNEALRRIKEMGLFATSIAEAVPFHPKRRAKPFAAAVPMSAALPKLGGRIKPAVLVVFTRQLATLIEAGMPLLRGLRVLEEQAENRALQRILADIAEHIESGGPLSEALAAHPRVFNHLYVNMVRAGELGGALEIAFRRLAEFMEKARKIKGKVQAALFYPVAVLTVATAILGVLMVYVIPQFQEVFQEMFGGAAMPAFTLFVFGISTAVKNHFFMVVVGGVALAGLLQLLIRTRKGRRWFDRLKLTVPLLGPVFRKAAISRFARTLGTLLNSGVPVLQALKIVKETAGNVIVGNVISRVHDSVKEGETIAAPLKASRVFPAMVAGMVDIGEQTGALPDMLMKIADNYDEEVDNAVSAMTSVLEPIMIVVLALVVGAIVIALFLPIIAAITGGGGGGIGGEP